ncbi:MAG: allantoinase AllB [Flavobacteriales bacterium]|nr:allantoinase AllB [Flavobacteriales bacterium]
MKRFAIHSQRTVMPHGVFDATILIEDGVIVMALDGATEGMNVEIIDVGNAVLMPGVIDPHVHINEPGRTDWEGFDSATKAAAAGGITSMIEMPLNASPVTTTTEALEMKLRATEGKLHVNCGFWGGIVPDNAGKLEPLLRSGVFGIKAFLVNSGLPEFPHVSKLDLRKGMPAIAESGMPLLAHSELESPHDHNPIIDNRTHLQSRPSKWEDDAIELLINLCSEYRARTHIVHLSSSDSLKQIEEAKERGLPLTVETCPHYLVFDAESIPAQDTLYKCAPPIRSKANNERLWKAIKDGKIDFITSDHSPAPPELKHLDDHNFEQAWGGIAGLQFLLSAFWTGASARNLELTDICRLMCQAPAEFVGLENKGKIVPGYDADLIVWDPDKKVSVNRASIYHKHKATPYSDLSMNGKVLKTFVNGELVYEEGEFISLRQGQVLLK